MKKDSYWEIYEMEPNEQVEPGWFSLRWRPLWFGTVGLYLSRSPFDIGLKVWKGGAHNGWHRRYDRIDVRIMLGWWWVNFWIKYNYRVHRVDRLT